MCSVLLTMHTSDARLVCQKAVTARTQALSHLRAVTVIPFSSLFSSLPARSLAHSVPKITGCVPDQLSSSRVTHPARRHTGRPQNVLVMDLEQRCACPPVAAGNK